MYCTSSVYFLKNYRSLKIGLTTSVIFHVKYDWSRVNTSAAIVEPANDVRNY